MVEQVVHNHRHNRHRNHRHNRHRNHRHNRHRNHRHNHHYHIDLKEEDTFRCHNRRRHRNHRHRHHSCRRRCRSLGCRHQNDDVYGVYDVYVYGVYVDGADVFDGVVDVFDDVVGEWDESGDELADELGESVVEQQDVVALLKRPPLTPTIQLIQLNMQLFFSYTIAKLLLGWYDWHWWLCHWRHAVNLYIS